MKAIQFNASIPRYAVGKTLGKLLPNILWSGLSCTFASDVPEPALPGEDWVVVKTRFGGICGTDMGTIELHTSPYFDPYSSYPFTLGHENVGFIDKTGSDPGEWRPGDRVVAEPLLWCRPRGFTDLCRFCAAGEINRCERITEGALSPGIMIGFCRDTGGSWSSHFLAHKSQLYRVPKGVSDENAVMVEPFAVGLHAALTHFPEDDDAVLIQGAGTIGLCTLAALRGLGSKARIITAARYPFQAEAARQLGATEVITGSDDVYQSVADTFEGQVYKPIIGKRVVAGGADLTYECVGSDGSIDDALRFTRNGGTAVLVGVPGIAKGIDWTSIFAQELTIKASNVYHRAESFEGTTHTTFALALELMASGRVDLGPLVTHKFILEDYAQALRISSNRKQHRAIKTLFTFDP